MLQMRQSQRSEISYVKAVFRTHVGMHSVYAFFCFRFFARYETCRVHGPRRVKVKH